jgi:PHD/YefM family antitoxin component YafN of YafNO toxin-antitoxin module
MTYAASYFRANMWEILDKTRYNREYTTIWRRGKKEFYIISAELWEEKNIDKNFEIFEIEEENFSNEELNSLVNSSESKKMEKLLSNIL